MADISDIGNSCTAIRHRLIIWCVPRSGSTALLKCLSFLGETPIKSTNSNNCDNDSENKCYSNCSNNCDRISTADQPRKGCEAWFEPYNMSRFARIASRKLYKEELPPDLIGNEDLYHRAIKGMETMLPVVPGGLKNPDPYLISLGGIKKALETSESEILVVKDIAAAIYGNFDYIPTGFRHVFLIKDPKQVFISLRKLFLGFLRLDENAMLKADIQKFHPFYAARHWFGEIYDLWKHVRSTSDPNPLIIDTKDLLDHPESCLKKICEVMGVGYRTNLLEWDASLGVVGTWRNGVSESLFADGVREALGMKRAFESTHFVSPSSQSPPFSALTPDCIRIAEECEEWYREMHQHRFIPTNE